MSITSLVTAVEEAHGAAAINPWVVGIVVLAILLALMVALLVFGKGREHA